MKKCLVVCANAVIRILSERLSYKVEFLTKQSNRTGMAAKEGKIWQTSFNFERLWLHNHWRYEKTKNSFRKTTSLRIFFAKGNLMWHFSFYFNLFFENSHFYRWYMGNFQKIMKSQPPWEPLFFHKSIAVNVCTMVWILLNPSRIFWKGLELFQNIGKCWLKM